MLLINNLIISGAYFSYFISIGNHVDKSIILAHAAVHRHADIRNNLISN